MRETREEHLPPTHEDKKRYICGSLATDFIARYNVFGMAKLGDIAGTCHARQRNVSQFKDPAKLVSI